MEDNITYLETIKLEKKGVGKIRDETEVEIHEKVYDALLALTKGARIKKIRFLLPQNNRTFELDIYTGKYMGLVTIEVEFPSEKECDGFEPPQWFGKEVTAIKAYTNHSLAVHGIPKNTPLHDTKKLIAKISHNS
jgi:CYTH domain-containing protein